MTKRIEQSTRDRAIWIVRGATIGGLAGALGLTWGFSNLAEAYFSGKQRAAPAPPSVPVAAAPVQAQRAVVTTVVHHAYGSSYSGGGATTSGSGGTTTAPAGGGTTPVSAPAPPPPPACVSTPSKPC